MNRSTLNRLCRYFASVAVLFMAGVAQAEDCRSATAGTAQWQNAPMPPVQNNGYSTQPGLFAVDLVVTPHTAAGDMLVALAQGPQTDWRGLAAIVRFNADGKIDVRDGSGYRADADYPYVVGGDYYIRIEVNLYAHTYSAYADNYSYSTGQRQGTLIAKDYSFRSEQQSISTLDTVVTEAEVGAITNCAMTAKPILAAAQGSAQWQNAGIGTTSIEAAVYFDVVPLAANSDMLLALTKGPQTFWGNLPMIVRFNSSGTIDVRDGDVYRSDVVVPYVPGKHYRISIFFHRRYDGQADSYDVSVGPEGEPGRIVANGYRLRTGYEFLDAFDNWALEAETGAIWARFVYLDTY